MSTGSARPAINRLFRFQWEPAQQAHVLLYPEGMVKLNQSAGEILKRCDGERSVQEIVADLEAAFNASGLTADVEAFLKMADEQNWIEWSPTAPTRPSVAAPQGGAGLPWDGPAEDLP